MQLPSIYSNHMIQVKIQEEKKEPVASPTCNLFCVLLLSFKSKYMLFRLLQVCILFIFLGKTYFSTKKAGKKYKNLIAHLHLSIYTYNSFLYYVHVSVKIISTELKIKIKIVKK